MLRHFKLRPATMLDYRFCYNLTKKNMMALFTQHWGGWNAKAFRDGFSTRKTKIMIIGGRRYEFLSIRKDDTLIYIENIQLSESVRGQGIGTKILTKIIDQNPGKRIELTTFINNPALQLYKKCGFKIKKNSNGTILMIRKA